MLIPNIYDHSPAVIKVLNESEANRQYYRLHIESGEVATVSTKVAFPSRNGVTRLELLEAIDDWNRGSDRYKYWTNNEIID